MDSRRGGSGVPRARLVVPDVGGMERLRLVHELDGVHKTGLALVVAPAGSGKTTLMADWAHRFAGPVAWYRVDTDDAEPAVLLEHLAAALGHALDTALPAGDLDQLLVATEDTMPGALLVVDDVHVLGGTAAEAVLERLVLLSPAQLVLLLGGRRQPAVNLARGELRGAVLVTADELRFRSWEVERLFRDHYGAPLPPDDAALLSRRTEGWAAALHLFHLSTRHRGPRERKRAISALEGRSRYAHGYLSEQVLADLPAPLRDFLRLTCVFDVVTAQRCDALLGRGDSQEQLLDLERRQALVLTDDDGRSFRYHEVLRRHLETALRTRLGTEAVVTWYSRAAELLELEGAAPEALRAWARAGQWEEVRRLLAERGAVVAGDAVTDWVELLPEWLTVDDPWVGHAQARRLLDDGRLEAASSAGRRAAALATEPRARELCTQVTLLAEAWAGSTPRPSARWFDLLRSATRRSPLLVADQAATASATGPPGERAALLLVVGVASALGGDLARSREALRACLLCDPDLRIAVGARLALAGLGGITGARLLDDAALDDAALDAERHDLGWFARLTRVLAAVREVPGRPHVVAEVIRECDDRQDAWGALVAAGVAGMASLRTPEPDAESLAAAERRARALGAGVLEAWARCAGVLAVAATDPAVAATARAAESLARLNGVPGAVTLAQLASTWNAAGPGAAAPRTQLAALGPAPWPAGLAPPPRLPRNQARTTWASATAVTAQAAAVDVRVLGGLRLRVDGADVDLAGIRPRTRALLRLLALHAGRPVHREHLLDALWPDLAPPAATHNLQVAVSSLRGVLARHWEGGGRLVAREGEAYLLALPTGSTSDVRRLDELSRDGRAAAARRDDRAAAAALAQAVAAYTGDVLPEDGPAEWVVTERQRYRVAAADAATVLAEVELRLGNPERAAAAAARSVDIDPYRDQGWRLLVAAHERTGDVAAAEHVRQAYAEVLSSLGIDG